MADLLMSIGLLVFIAVLAQFFPPKEPPHPNEDDYTDAHFYDNF